MERYYSYFELKAKGVSMEKLGNEFYDRYYGTEDEDHYGRIEYDKEEEEELTEALREEMVIKQQTILYKEAIKPFEHDLKFFSFPDFVGEFVDDSYDEYRIYINVHMDMIVTKEDRKQAIEELEKINEFVDSLFYDYSVETNDDFMERYDDLLDELGYKEFIEEEEEKEDLD